MREKLQQINRVLLTLGFIISNILWIKTFFDIISFHNVEPTFNFPSFFIPLFGVGAFINLILSGYFLKVNWENQKNLRAEFCLWQFFIWLSIPVSVLCLSPVCYSGTIFIAPYLPGTIIRIGLLIIPVVAGLLYYKNKMEIGILILLICSFLLLVPNDKCYNPFNHWWISKIGASPLTYLPVMLVILFAVVGLNGKNKYLIFIIIYGISTAALFISIGHRYRILW